MFITLKSLSSYLASTLSRIVNLSLLTSRIPNGWRHAIVTPVAKAPRLTPVVCKVLEAILKEKMLVHLSQFSLLTS